MPRTTDKISVHTPVGCMHFRTEWISKSCSCWYCSFSFAFRSSFHARLINSYPSTSSYLWCAPVPFFLPRFSAKEPSLWTPLLFTRTKTFWSWRFWPWINSKITFHLTQSTFDVSWTSFKLYLPAYFRSGTSFDWVLFSAVTVSSFTPLLTIS